MCVCVQNIIGNVASTCNKYMSFDSINHFLRYVSVEEATFPFYLMKQKTIFCSFLNCFAILKLLSQKVLIFILFFCIPQSYFKGQNIFIAHNSINEVVVIKFQQHIEKIVKVELQSDTFERWQQQQQQSVVNKRQSK